jgi:hypothetical protein
MFDVQFSIHSIADGFHDTNTLLYSSSRRPRTRIKILSFPQSQSHTRRTRAGMIYTEDAFSELHTSIIHCIYISSLIYTLSPAPHFPVAVHPFKSTTRRTTYTSFLKFSQCPRSIFSYTFCPPPSAFSSNANLHLLQTPAPA